MSHNSETLLHVSALNQYLYCPRRLWYYRFYNPEDRSPDLVEGQATHQRQARQRDQFREQYFAAPELGLHGRVDLIETGHGDQYVPVERKRATSKRYYWNDEVQLAGYCLLIEKARDEVEMIDRGYIYLYSTDQRHEIDITDEHREAVRETLSHIQELDPAAPPSTADNPNKCQACSIRHRCLPTTVNRLASVSIGSDQLSMDTKYD